jgi:ankyrin repeat protein
MSNGSNLCRYAAALESHLADTTWKAETAPGSGRRAALHLAIINCDVAAVDALVRRDLIRQVILPDSVGPLYSCYIQLTQSWKPRTPPLSPNRNLHHQNWDLHIPKPELPFCSLLQCVRRYVSDACIPLFYAALRGVRMLRNAVRRLKGLEKFTPEYVSELLEAPNSHGQTPLHVVINSVGLYTLTQFTHLTQLTHSLQALGFNP